MKWLCQISVAAVVWGKEEGDVSTEMMTVSARQMSRKEGQRGQHLQQFFRKTGIDKRNKSCGTFTQWRTTQQN